MATGPLIAQSSESRQVWVNNASGVYPVRGGTVTPSQGKYMSEAEARTKGYRPAGNGQ
jgi:hypothetical protein